MINARVSVRIIGIHGNLRMIGSVKMANRRTVTMIVKCKPTQPDKQPCPMIRLCIARMNDRTITGCGIPLWYAGVIRREQVEVEHTVKGHGTTLHGRKSAKRKKDGEAHD